ncbi:hypothetical protein [Natronococcus occultus]|uniref:Uncharacterized protein n=1 Tax=Natronococcus occultus SP4 TaxID=694430 RepID=L0K0G4_9EURY|nr:hypothetical protein [Natronococcus occultus]AGB38050.1 hypothetical protein Natoc_2272 [Natronococcus occultus SP4]
MRVFSDIDPDTYDRIEEVVRDGKYRDVDQFIRVAVQNQLNIERADEEQTSPSPDVQTNKKSDGGYAWGYSIPDNPPVSSPHEMNRENELLFQQYYRFFPLFPVLVELAEVTAETGEPAVLDEFRDHIVEKIEPLRDAIVDWEETNNVKKKNRKSTGLPKKDVKNPEYSEKRYLDHFVGKIRKRDLAPKSFPHSLGFIAYEPIDEEKCLMQLTPAGKELLQYENPLLGNGPDSPSLSREEREFLVTHIESELPAEYRLMEFVYSTLPDDGNKTYTNWLDEFGEYLKEEGELDEDASEERVRSHIAGVLSRMVELGILDRGSKRGVYIPTIPPGEFLNGPTKPTA